MKFVLMNSLSYGAQNIAVDFFSSRFVKKYSETAHEIFKQDNNKF